MERITAQNASWSKDHGDFGRPRLTEPESLGAGLRRGACGLSTRLEGPLPTGVRTMGLQLCKPRKEGSRWLCVKVEATGEL